MQHNEIARDIVIAMIAKGFFDGTDTRESQSAVQKSKVDAVCEAYKQIAAVAVEAHKMR